MDRRMMKRKRSQAFDSKDSTKHIPLPIQAFLWRQTSPFIKPKLNKLYEASSVTFERILVENKVQGLSPSLSDAIASISRWRLIKVSLPHLMHCCASLLRSRIQLGHVDKLGVPETKLLYTLHWIIMEAPAACQAQDSPCYPGQAYHTLPVETIQLFVYLFAPLVHTIKEGDLTFRLASGLRLWQTLWVCQTPDFPCFTSLVKPCQLPASKATSLAELQPFHRGVHATRSVYSLQSADDSILELPEEEVGGLGETEGEATTTDEEESVFHDALSELPQAPLVRLADICDGSSLGGSSGDVSGATSPTSLKVIVCQVCQGVVEGGQNCSCGKLTAATPQSMSSLSTHSLQQNSSPTTSKTQIQDNEVFQSKPLTFKTDVYYATYFDVAVLRCLFISHWSEDATHWALTYLLNRLKQIVKESAMLERCRMRSNSTPVPRIEVSMFKAPVQKMFSAPPGPSLYTPEYYDSDNEENIHKRYKVTATDPGRGDHQEPKKKIKKPVLSKASKVPESIIETGEESPEKGKGSEHFQFKIDVVKLHNLPSLKEVDDRYNVSSPKPSSNTLDEGLLQPFSFTPAESQSSSPFPSSCAETLVVPVLSTNTNNLSLPDITTSAAQLSLDHPSVVISNADELSEDEAQESDPLNPDLDPATTATFLESGASNLLPNLPESPLMRSSSVPRTKSKSSLPNLDIPLVSVDDSHSYTVPSSPSEDTPLHLAVPKPDSSFPRSQSDSFITYDSEGQSPKRQPSKKRFDPEEIHEAPGSTYYCTKNGQINYTVLLKGLHSVIMREKSTRICDVALGLIEHLLDLTAFENSLKKQQEAKENDNKTLFTKKEKKKEPTIKDKKEHLEAMKLEDMTMHNLVMDTILRITRSLGCQHGCREGHKGGQTGERLRHQGRTCLNKLYKIDSGEFKNYLHYIVTFYPLATIVDFLHAFLGFCKEPTPHSGLGQVSPGDPNEGVARSGYATNFGAGLRGAGIYGIEGTLIGLVFKPLVSRFVENNNKIRDPDNSKLYADIRLLLYYVREAHGGIYRRVALSGLMDACQRREKNPEKKKTTCTPNPNFSKPSRTL